MTTLVCASGIVQLMNMVKRLTSKEAVSAMKKPAEWSYVPRGLILHSAGWAPFHRPACRFEGTFWFQACLTAPTRNTE